MKISYQWLKDYLDFDESPEEVAEILTNVGLEVESVEKRESVKGGLEGLIIGEVRSVEKHPDADKLTVTKVNIGSTSDLQIVCGAPNVAAGQKVIVATDGTLIHPFNGEPFKIKKAKIRGVESQGMICAEDEIGLSGDHGGIKVLPGDAPVGSKANEYLKISSDFIFEIGLTPNRGDAMSHIGVARDLAAFIQSIRQKGASLKIPDTNSFRVDESVFKIDVVVENPEACPRYSGVTISNVQVRESPEWLKQKLLSIGLRPINNVVDITNFVLWECGQPLHAFDADQITGKKVVVRMLAEGTVFTTLDEKEIKLAADDLMICDAEKGMCIAGIYGGKNSGVTEKTKNIFLESACFNPKFIRRTSTRHKLKTDAASHFEKGTDPNGTLYALKRAAELIREIGGGKISSDIIDIYPKEGRENNISLTWEKLTRISGMEFQNETAKRILKALQFKTISEDEKQITVAVPTFKTEVTLTEDLIEEIIRVNGLEKIPVPDAVRSSLSFLSEDKSESLREALSEMLAGRGFHEMINNSISNSKYHEDHFPETKDDVIRMLSFSNAGLDSLRTTMLFPMLDAVSYNQNRKMTDLKLFEFGKTYRQENGKYKEASRLVLVTSGNKFSESWRGKEEPADFYYLKGIVQNVLQRSGVKKYSAGEISNAIFEQGLSLSVGKSDLVSFGKLNQKVLSSFDIKREVWFADFDFDMLVKVSVNGTTYREPSKFPAVRRDLAMILDRKTTFDMIESLSFKSVKLLLKDVNLFDVYEGEKIGSGKKSYAVSFTFADEAKTLTDFQVDELMKGLTAAFEKELNAQIRS